MPKILYFRTENLSALPPFWVTSVLGYRHFIACDAQNS